MREILFRGKREDNASWIYGNYIYAPSNGDCYVYNICAPDTPYDWYEIGLKSLGQYIGRKDKNGAKIFEGDIVRTEFGRLCIVVWFDSRLVCGWDLEPIKTSENLLHDAPRSEHVFDEEYLEIVGNIYDNPELLTEN